jgi:predicted dehydrogenase
MSHETRRSFLSKMSLGASLLTIPTVQALPRDLDIFQEKKLGVALVGLGSYATNQLLPALRQSKFCELKGIVTGTPAKAEKWKKENSLSDKSIYDYTTFDRISDNKDIDVVYVVLPNSMHHEYVIRAAKAGKHVICEKPMAISVKEGEEMIAACKRAGVRFFVGYRLHYEPFNMEARRIGQKKEFGAVKVINTEFGFRAGDPNQWRLKKSLAGGGAMMDVGIYCIQANRYVTGEEPLYVTAQEYKTDKVKFKDVDETIFWQMEFPSGAVSNSTTSYASNVERLFFSAEDGWLELRPAYGYGPLAGKTSKGELKLPVVHHQTAQLDEMGQCIIQNRETTATGEEGLRDMKVIEAIYRSIADGGKRTKVQV